MIGTYATDKAMLRVFAERDGECRYSLSSTHPGSETRLMRTAPERLQRYLDIGGYQLVDTLPTCTACQTSDHPRAAHDDPALAHVEAERCVARGDLEKAAWWRQEARSAERRTWS